MAEMYHVTTVEVVQGTNLDVQWSDANKTFHLHIGSPCNDVTIMLDDKQLDRLAEVLRHAQYEQDIRTGSVVPDDSNGLVPGGKPVNATPEKCYGCGSKFAPSSTRVKHGQYVLCLGCNADDRVTVGKQAKTAG
jgi:hypothetical protein